MVADLHSESHRSDALSVCLGGENPHRLVSLWDVVNQFRAHTLYAALRRLEIFEARLLDISERQGDRELAASELQDVASTLEFCAAELQSANLLVLSKRSERHVISLSLEHRRNTSSIATVLSELRMDIDNELRERSFLWINPDRIDYLDRDDLFGPDVYDAFPLARQDIKEAGNCLAAECSTAAVFHLMRGAEIALRALAADRQVQYPDASLSSKQVGDLLSALDGKLADMRKEDAKHWPSKEIKDAQIKFYHTAIAEFRDFNEAWRKHMAHAHEGAFYDRHQAFSILEHVRQCMQNLAPKISENYTTPLCWITA